MRILSSALFVLAGLLLVYGVLRSREDCADAGGLAVVSATGRIVCLRSSAELVPLP